MGVFKYFCRMYIVLILGDTVALSDMGLLQLPGSFIITLGVLLGIVRNYPGVLYHFHSPHSN
jgi:hypothetical protein